MGKQTIAKVAGTFGSGTQKIYKLLMKTLQPLLLTVALGEAHQINIVLLIV